MKSDSQQFFLTEYRGGYSLTHDEGKPFVLVLDGLDARQVADSLCQAGLAAFGVTTIRDALHLIAEQPPDLIIVENELPDGSGAEVARQLKCNPKYAVPVVMYTDHEIADAWIRPGGLDAGIRKPDADALYRYICALLNRSGQHQ